MLNKRFGLDMVGNFGIGGDIFLDEDLVVGIKIENGDIYFNKVKI